MDLPAYFIVGDRPVRFLPTPEGGLDIEALNWQTGAFERDMSYLTRCLGPSPSEEADQVDEATFWRQVEAMRTRMK